MLDLAVAVAVESIELVASGVPPFQAFSPSGSDLLVTSDGDEFYVVAQ